MVSAKKTGKNSSHGRRVGAPQGGWGATCNKQAKTWWGGAPDGVALLATGELLQ